MSILSNLLKDLFIAQKPLDKLNPEESKNALEKIIAECFSRLNSGDIDDAENLCTEALQRFPHDQNLQNLHTEIEFHNCLKIVDQRLPGPNYLKWLAWFHSTLKPATYLEIGVESGQSLQFTRAPTRAVGVDPEIQIIHSQENWVKLFKQTSDDFFATHNPKQVFDSEVIELAFIDGLHTFDQALKDFINVERFSNKKSIALFHDIFPVVPITAQRDRCTRFWVGDTWKVMLILLQHRPDLEIFTIPTHPSGLGVVTGMNPDSTVLSDNFDLICQQVMELELDSLPGGIAGHLHLTENDFVTVGRRLNRG